MTRNAVITIFAAARFYNTKAGMANPSLSRIDYCNALLHSVAAKSWSMLLYGCQDCCAGRWSKAMPLASAKLVTPLLSLYCGNRTAECYINADEIRTTQLTYQLYLMSIPFRNK